MPSSGDAPDAKFSGKGLERRKGRDAGSAVDRGLSPARLAGQDSPGRVSFNEIAARAGLYGPPKGLTLTGRTEYADLVEKITSDMSREDLELFARFQAQAIEGWRYLAKKNQLESERLRQKIREHDRTSTFYRYHKGAKS